MTNDKLSTPVETTNGYDEDRFDPIGLEPIIGILGTAIGIVSLAYDFGILVPRHKRILEAFKRLRDETLRLHHCLDDAILTIHRHLGSLSENSPERSLPERPPTLSATLMVLRRHDYVRWRDIQEKLQSINKEVYRQAAEIRSALREIDEDELVAELEKEALKPFDNLLTGFSTCSFGDLVSGLRDAIIALENTLEKAIDRYNKRR